MERPGPAQSLTSPGHNHSPCSGDVSKFPEVSVTLPTTQPYKHYGKRSNEITLKRSANPPPYLCNATHVFKLICLYPAVNVGPPGSHPRLRRRGRGRDVTRGGAWAGARVAGRAGLEAPPALPQGSAGTRRKALTPTGWALGLGGQPRTGLPNFMRSPVGSCEGLSPPRRPAAVTAGPRGVSAVASSPDRGPVSLSSSERIPEPIPASHRVTQGEGGRGRRTRV